MIYQYADTAITEQQAQDFVATITGHLPPDSTGATALDWPLVVSSADGQSGIAAMLLDGSAALWSLPAGDDCADRFQLFDGDRLGEVTRYRNGREVHRLISPV